jgi:hypothetical protein
MGCPICDNKAANCDCTATEREQFDEIESLRAEITRLRKERRQREALWTACADKTQLIYGGAFRPMPLPPGSETK